jgi:pimeloyl-ACP methyl ester carboxylesterase
VRTSASFVELPFEGRTIRIEYAWIAPERRAAPLVVFLHEGLGSVAMWKDYPQRLCDAGDFRGLVYSRAGYGRSTPRPAAERWPVAFMHAQARDVLPRLLATLGVDAGRSKPWLFGHSDGGSIALIYAATFPRAVGGVIAAAPHIFVEDISVASIAAARAAYRTTDLRKKLARYHDDVDSAFWGWNDVWLDPRFRTWSIEALLPRLQCPILAIQGEDDEYGTLAQVEGIRRHVPGTELVVLRDCGHSPHRDQPAALTRAVTDFIGRHALAPTSQGGME